MRNRITLIIVMSVFLEGLKNIDYTDVPNVKRGEPVCKDNDRFKHLTDNVEMFKHLLIVL